MIASPLRLRLDGDALVANWRMLAAMSGPAACGAAVKANGYGLGARQVVRRLAGVGCRDFMAATWREAIDLAAPGIAVSVLHGARAEDMAVAVGADGVRPVLNTIQQVRRWREANGGACDVMVDTGMNRLGIGMEDVTAGLLDGLQVETLMSHLASADANSAMNGVQRNRFDALKGVSGARRMSLANSAGIGLGVEYAFDLTRPGIALYGGVPTPAFEGRIRQVVTPQAQILQRRRVPVGQPVGYNETWTAATDTEVAIVNLGYADGYLRCFSGKGCARADGIALPVIGRVSMDLTVIDVSGAPDLAEGDWVSFDYPLPETAALSGLSQYELITGLGSRFDHSWDKP